jgi:hypothetical protein
VIKNVGVEINTDMRTFYEYLQEQNECDECMVLAVEAVQGGYTIEEIREHLLAQGVVLDEGFWGGVGRLAKGAVAGAGNFGSQAVRGGLNVLGGVGRGVAGAGMTGLGAATKDWKLAKAGLSQLGKAGAQVGGGAVQALASPVTGLVRGAQAIDRNRLGMSTGSDAGAFFGLNKKKRPDPMDAPEDLPPAPSGRQSPSPSPLPVVKGTRVPPPLPSGNPRAVPPVPSRSPNQGDTVKLQPRRSNQGDTVKLQPQPAAKQKQPAIIDHKQDPIGFLNQIPTLGHNVLLGRDPAAREQRAHKLFDWVRKYQMKWPDQATAAMNHIAKGL